MATVVKVKKIEVVFYELTELMKQDKSILILDTASIYSVTNLKLNEDFGPDILLPEVSNEKDVIKRLMQDLEEFKRINNLPNLSTVYYSQSNLYISKFFATFSSRKPHYNFRMKFMDALIKREKETNGYDVNRQNFKYYGNTEIMTAVADSSNELALTLMRRYNANPFIVDTQGKNCLHLLICKGRKMDFLDGTDFNMIYNHSNMMPTFKAILEHPQFKNYKNDRTMDGHTAMHLACIRKDFDYIKPLIDYGADLYKQKDYDGNEPLDFLYLPKENVKAILLKYFYLRPAIISDFDHRDIVTINRQYFNK